MPCFVRWTGTIPAGEVRNGIVSHQDWLPTSLAAAGEPEIQSKLQVGHQAGSKTFRVHIDGEDMLSYFKGEVADSPRKSFFYVNDDGQLVALRYDRWKLVFMEQRAKTLQLWAEPFVELRVPKMFDLRMDPFERADEHSNTYWDWLIDHAFLLYGAQALVAAQLESFRRFPPRQKPPSFNLDRILAQLTDAGGGGMH